MIDYIMIASILCLVGYAIYKVHKEPSSEPSFDERIEEAIEQLKDQQKIPTETGTHERYFILYDEHGERWLVLDRDNGSTDPGACTIAASYNPNCVPYADVMAQQFADYLNHANVNLPQ